MEQKLGGARVPTRALESGVIAARVWLSVTLAGQAIAVLQTSLEDNVTLERRPPRLRARAISFSDPVASALGGSPQAIVHLRQEG